MIGQTAAQARCLDAIKALTINGVRPSYRELQAELALPSVNNVAQLLNQLKARGHVTWISGMARSLRVLERAPPEALVEAVHILCTYAATEITVPTKAAIAEALAEAMGSSR